MKYLIIGILTVAVSTAALAQELDWPEHPLLTDEVKAELQEKQVAVAEKMESGKSGNAKAVVMGIVDAPPETVWEELNDFEGQQEWTPKVESAKIYTDNSDPDRSGVAFTTRVMLRTLAYHLMMRIDPEIMRVDYSLDEEKENDFERIVGAWQAYPLAEGKSFVVHEIDIKTGIAIPQFLQRFFMNKDLPDIVVSLKKRVESGGTWTR